MDGQKCENCRFWQDHGHRNERGAEVNLVEGICRRYPPVYHNPLHKDGQYDSRQPSSDAAEWCGEWQAKSATPTGTTPDALAATLWQIEMPVRIGNMLESIGIKTIGDLAGTTADALLEIVGFGSSSLEVVRGKLANHGLTLKGEWRGYPYIWPDMKQPDDTRTNVEPTTD